MEDNEHGGEWPYGDLPWIDDDGEFEGDGGDGEEVCKEKSLTGVLQCGQDAGQ
jgi:hypothetical protein